MRERAARLVFDYARAYDPVVDVHHDTHHHWCRVHKALRVTPAIEVGLMDHVWSLGEPIGLLD